MKINCVTIVGLGLIGGSLAKSLKQKLNIEKIIGIDENNETLDVALSQGVIDLGFSNVTNEIKKSQIIFVATPVNFAFEYIKKAYEIAGQDVIFTDMCSTKNELINEVEQNLLNIDFVGGHPMAGSEKFGYMASSANLFENAYYILVKSKNTKQNSIDTLYELLKKVGAIPYILSPKDHDMAVSAISHLPHIVASALVNSAKSCEIDDDILKRLAAGGFRDITRIASSNPKMWQNITVSNKEAVLKMLDNFINILNDFKKQLTCENNKDILSFFENAKKFRDSFDQNIKSLIPNSYILVSDVCDKPGVIANASMLLFKEGINIKNITISNSREFEGGALHIAFENYEELLKATKIMKENGYKVKEN